MRETTLAQEVRAGCGAVILRPALPADAQAIHALACRIWPECYAELLSEGQIESILAQQYSDAALRDQMQQGQRFWLAHAQNTLSGFVSALRDEDTIWVKKLYVHSQQRGRALGRTLLDHAVTALGPASQVRLLVHRANLKAQQFYLRMGFAPAGEQRVRMGDYYFTDLVFAKALT